MLGRKRFSGDKTTRELQASGVYTIGHGPHPYIVENRTVEAVKTKRIYGFWSGVWYTSVLSVLLFWIPPFGQIVAGYVGGRKAGAPFKGLAATLAPMSFIFLLFMLKYSGFFVTEIDWFLSLPGQGAEWMGQNLPVLGPAIDFMSQYIQALVSATWSYEYIIYPYTLTVIFGYIGGALSLQHQRELEAQGKEHPFVPLTIVSQPNAAPQETPSQPEVPVVMGKVPDDWNKQNKKGKW